MQTGTSNAMILPEILSLSIPRLEPLAKLRQKLGNNKAHRHIRQTQVDALFHKTRGAAPLEGKQAVFSQILSALLRATLVALLVAIPALFLPWVAKDTAQIVVIIALLLSLLTFIEYFGRYPSFVEFRFAPPYNRLKFGAAALVVITLSLIARGHVDPSPLTMILTYIGHSMGHAMEFPYSPVQLFVLMLPSDASPDLVDAMRTAAGFAYVVSILMVFIFVILVRMMAWPMRYGAFNVWINLPLFDPTRGGDIVDRLKRDSGLNIVLGVLLPFLIPAVIKAASFIIDPISIESSQTLIWITTVWAILPASILMRGIALLRVAELIEAKRKRVYAQAEAESIQEA
ncbi:MAG: hypothetical protein AAF922_00145 [Pseudomonadota bacterium]